MIAAAALLATAGDVATLALGLTRPGFAEGNPAVVVLLEAGGILLAIAARSASIAVGLAAAELAGRARPWIRPVVLAAILAAGAVGTVSNVLAIA